jgi:hypothetical protein
MFLLHNGTAAAISLRPGIFFLWLLCGVWCERFGGVHNELGNSIKRKRRNAVMNDRMVRKDGKR